MIFAGIIIMLLSYIIPSLRQYKFRWIFGVGLYICLFSVGAFSTFFRQHQSLILYTDTHDVYEGIIIDLPKQKPNTVAIDVRLKNPDRRILCYLPKDSSSRKLEVGNGFTFFAKIEPFKSVARSDEFDYARYMYNRGYAGVAFVESDKWERVLVDHWNVFVLASKCRLSILNFYKSLDLNNTEYAVLSGLTLGYKDELHEDLIQSFRNTGTAHILAVSGLHVAVIFGVLLALFGFIPRHSHYFALKQLLIILTLWMYAFVVGLPPSAIRACFMLTLFCCAEMFRMKGYSCNTIFAAAFCILVWNPFQLFDLGFQLSFSAVFSIRLLMPLFSRVGAIKNKCLRYIANIFWMSIAAQLGIFPLCLYYFGTFPVYFFITNLLVIPLVTLAIYDAVAILLTGVVSFFFSSFGYYMSYLPIWIFKKLVWLITGIAQFFEHLPYALLDNVKIDFWQIFVVWTLIAAFIYCWVNKNAKFLMCSMACLLLLMVSSIINRYANRDTLIVYNNPKDPNVVYQLGYKTFALSSTDNNQILNLNDKKYLIVTDDHWKGKSSSLRLDVDYLHLETKESVSLYAMNQLFNIKKVILGSSIPQYTAKRYILECEKLRIPYYHVSDNGTLRINF